MVLHGGDALPGRERRARFAAVPDFALPFSGLLKGVPKIPIEFITLPLRLQQAGMLANDLVRAIPRYYGECTVYGNDRIVGIGNDDGIVGVFKDRRGLPQSLLRFRHFRHVEYRRPALDEISMIVEYRGCT